MSSTSGRAPLTTYARRALGVWVLAGIAAACSSTPEAAPTASDYRADVQAVCTATSEARNELIDPAEPAEVAEFARTVARLLTAEADAIRVIRPPEELDDDHRAFVQNTADQAARWTTLATTPASDTGGFGALTDEIASLSFGRDDLALEMQLTACRRTP